MMEASDSLTNNYLVQRGLSEGWMTVDSDMLLMYNRKLAFDFDRNEYAIKQASALDEAAEIERYNKMMEGGTDPATQPVQGDEPATRWKRLGMRLMKAQLASQRLVKMLALIKRWLKQSVRRTWLLCKRRVQRMRNSVR